ncbi:aminoglycoside adenylyltransferase domain-containing protein [Paracoccus aerius]|uniref:Aminoglycoside (3'') (9) adenylyltransferase n=1 Tax=Paracoccus aerius TaxID=1915382 RepID=A0ABS1S8J0_9RHOB|nr:aminoglycoside adenylyltransferase domain-containing protein [Paracoccus aerius]MBL3674880.1 DUF4111 domain-containing protein [Paracoccus aerius]GHG29091.1 aminoglycoside nucleotidyltransferase ANT9 [Paracoccus aerius]
MQSLPENIEQVSAGLADLCNILGDSLLAIYLHGSAISGGLRPQSDIDLLAVVDRGLVGNERAALLSSLLQLSGCHPPVPGAPCCLELVVFTRHDLAGHQFPTRAEFVYGEWLRDAFEAGEMPMPTEDPEFTLVLAQARQEARTLFGPDKNILLPEVSETAVRAAMRELLPSLLNGLQDDTRNVLLTLARMWRTASSGAFVSKDEAAMWAIPSLTKDNALTLAHARRAYLGEVADDWRGRWDAARRLADQLALNVTKAMAA